MYTKHGLSGTAKWFDVLADGFLDAVIGPGSALVANELSDRVIASPVGIVDIAAGMIQVQHHGTEANMQSAYSGVFQSFAKFTIQAAVFHSFVKTVHGQNVVTPARGIVAVPSRLGRSSKVQDGGQILACDEP